MENSNARAMAFQPPPGRLANLTQSYIRRMTRECERLGGINLGQGVCDLPTPPEILAATSAAILADDSMYSKFEGTDNLRRQIADKARHHNRLPQVDADTDVVVTIGATGAFNCVVQGLLNPGDEVIVFEPYYGYHVNTLLAGGVKPVFVPLAPPAWELSPAALQASLSPRTRALLVNTPGNPSGKVFSRDELAMVAAFCQANELLAITDEIYEYIVYDGRRHLSLAALPGMWERTVTISGFSKTFSITGWRLGYAIAPANLARTIGLVNDLLYICAPTPLQQGVAKGMAALPASYYADMAADYQGKRDLFCAALQAAKLPPCTPQGAYYVLADATALNCADDIAAAMHVLETVGVASVPGSSFFDHPPGPHLLRFCYAKDWDVLRQAGERLGGLRPR